MRLGDLDVYNYDKKFIILLTDGVPTYDIYNPNVNDLDPTKDKVTEISDEGEIKLITLLAREKADETYKYYQGRESDAVYVNINEIFKRKNTLVYNIEDKDIEETLTGDILKDVLIEIQENETNTNWTVYEWTT